MHEFFQASRLYALAGSRRPTPLGLSEAGPGDRITPVELNLALEPSSSAACYGLTSKSIQYSDSFFKFPVRELITTASANQRRKCFEASDAVLAVIEGTISQSEQCVGFRIWLQYSSRAGLKLGENDPLRQAQLVNSFYALGRRSKVSDCAFGLIECGRSNHRVRFKLSNYRNRVVLESDRPGNWDCESARWIK